MRTIVSTEALPTGPKHTAKWLLQGKKRSSLKDPIARPCAPLRHRVPSFPIALASWLTTAGEHCLDQLAIIPSFQIARKV
jgi:hypothetical protein